MLAYAASRPAVVERGSHPNFLLGIIAAHVAVIALVMSAKMDLPARILGTKTDVFWVPPPHETPPESTPKSTPQTPNHQTTVTRTDQVVKTDLPPSQPPLGGGLTDPGPGQGTDVAINIPVFRPPVPDPIRLGPALLTSGEDLKPPYPVTKLASEEEATLTLRLSIDERGRVIGVEPVGRTDRVFLEAARRHLIAHWRYRPATEDGHPKPSSAVITLRFQLDG